MNINQIKIFGVFIIALAAAACGGPTVLLEPPELLDEIPNVTTGFYTVHNMESGVPSDNPGNEFIGNLAYIYNYIQAINRFWVHQMCVVYI